MNRQKKIAILRGSSARSAVVAVCLLVNLPNLVAAQQYFGIRVVDGQTSRGVPLVKVRVSGQDYYTDSAGLAAIDATSFANQTFPFVLSSYGYTSSVWPLQATPGALRDVSIPRSQLAERMYRVTGAGIYQDSVRLGRPTPLANPLSNANVKGQDSVQTALYKNQLYWFWGDTLYEVGFGNFQTSGAISQLPGQGGLDPASGVNLNYFVNSQGSSKPMMPLAQPGPVWIDGLFTIRDEANRERLLTHYSRRDPQNALGAQVEHGLAIFNDSQAIFQRHQVYPLSAPITAVGHVFQHTLDGQYYSYFGESYPNVRVKMNWADVIDPAQWEAFTPLLAGSRYNAANPPLERDSQGQLVYGWKKNVNPLTTEMLEELVTNGHVDRNASPFGMREAGSGDPVRLHRASVSWNNYRNSWVMIGNEWGGQSFLGEVWFAEAPTPEGPWRNAIKVATHHNEGQNYTLYNPKQHPYFAGEGGRYVYFEGTYAETFSGNPTPTPLYDYNQLMFRLDLAEIPPLFARLSGDYNRDGQVDAADYNVWRDTAGSTTDLRANGDNTASSLGVVDLADYVAWRSNFGSTSTGAAAGAIPEPTTRTLIGAALVVMGLIAFRWQARRSTPSRSVSLLASSATSDCQTTSVCEVATANAPYLTLRNVESTLNFD